MMSDKNEALTVIKGLGLDLHLPLPNSVTLGKSRCVGLGHFICEGRGIAQGLEPCYEGCDDVFKTRCLVWVLGDRLLQGQGSVNSVQLVLE